MNIGALLISHIQQPIVFYTIVLTIVWLLLQVIGELSKGTSKLSIWRGVFSIRILSIIFFIYISLTALLVHLNNIALFPLLHSIMLGIILLIALSVRFENSKSNLLFTYSVFAIALMPVLVMVATRHPYPLVDDARFSGFAVAINNDGRWIPYKYHENPYYQFFHLIPFLEYVLAMIAGIGLENVIGFHLPLKIGMYTAYLLLVYLVVKVLSRSHVIPLVATLLLSITPPLAMPQVIPQAYAIILLLSVSYLLLKRIDKGLDARPILAMYLLFASGIVAHATFTVMCLAFALPLMLVSVNSGSRKSIERLLLLLSVASLSYWMYTYVMDIIVRPTYDAVERFIDLLTGRAIPWHGVPQPWYIGETQTFFVAWALIPSTVGAYLLFSVFQHAIKRKMPSFDLVTLLGFLGLAGTSLNYLLRTIPTFGGRYFYWLYLLMLPLSAIVITKITKKSISLAVTVLLISSISFYGIQDPTLSANTYGNYIAWPDKTDWYIGLSIAPYINHEALTWLDPRIGNPISSIPRTPMNQTFSAQQVFALIGMDNVGLTAMKKDPRYIRFFRENFNIEPDDVKLIVDRENVVLNTGKYLGILKP